MSKDLLDEMLEAFYLAANLGCLPDDEDESYKEDERNAMKAVLKVVLERAAQKATSELENWAYDLQETRDEYITARTTGKMANRNISPELAKVFASQFGERSDAVYGCVEMVADAIYSVGDINTPPPSS